MKKLAITPMAMLICQLSFGQVSGNANYQTQVHFPDNNIHVNIPSNGDINISVKGLANVKADTYVAIFNVTQVGKTTQEVNQLMDERITLAINEIKQKKEVETFVDMISFVPVYELETEKKIFSKKTYNEIPTGFELKKNIHIKYSDPNQLNEFIAILSNNEIYDLIRVDYFSNNLETVKKDMMNRAKLIVQEKIKNYESILGETFVNVEKKIADGFKVSLPLEMYKSYEAYNCSWLTQKKYGNVNQASKSSTLYYQPIIDKEFDFVINPTILEPVIQVMYELKISISREKKQSTTANKEYILITPNGEIKSLEIGK